MTSPQDFDFIVIGGGSAGYAAARTAVENGLSTAVIDGAETLGGLCILRGCMPSKTLIESADRFRNLREAEAFGLRAGAPDVHPAEIIARKRRLIGEFAEYRQEQLEDGRFTLIRGTAAFTSPHSVAVTLRGTSAEGDTAASESPLEIRFKTACVATGSVVSRIDIPGLEETGYLTSDDVLNLESPPDSIVVLGGGAIALEMACYFEGIGKKVTVVQRSPHLLTGTDHDIADALADALRERDMQLFTGTKLERVEQSSSGCKVVHFEHDEKSVAVDADEILLALGRRPNTDGLNLQAAGINLAWHHIDANAEMATSAAHIFTAGDVSGPHEVVHTAIEQGETAAHNAAILLRRKKGKPRSMDYRLKLYGIFTHPSVGTVGLSELEAEREGRAVEIATYPFDDHGKSMVKGETAGFVKMIGDASTGELLGASVIGPEAVELIHELVVALHFRATAEEFLRIPHYHPTLSEIWSYPAEEIAEKTTAKGNAD